GVGLIWVGKFFDLTFRLQGVKKTSDRRLVQFAGLARVVQLPRGWITGFPQLDEITFVRLDIDGVDVQLIKLDQVAVTQDGRVRQDFINRLNFFGRDFDHVMLTGQASPQLLTFVIRFLTYQENVVDRFRTFLSAEAGLAFDFNTQEFRVVSIQAL